MLLFDSYHNDLYKCIYNEVKEQCNATASLIYTTYQLTTWKRLIDSRMDCKISKYLWCQYWIKINIFWGP